MSGKGSSLGYDGEVKWIPVRAAAKLLRVSRQRVARLCKTGALVELEIEGTHLVSLRSVENRLAGVASCSYRRNG